MKKKIEKLLSQHVELLDEGILKRIKLSKLAKKSLFLYYRVNQKNLKEKEFMEFSFFKQKQLLLRIIYNNNNLYVNYLENKSLNYEISRNEKISVINSINNFFWRINE